MIKEVSNIVWFFPFQHQESLDGIDSITAHTPKSDPPIASLTWLYNQLLIQMTRIWNRVLQLFR